MKNLDSIRKQEYVLNIVILVAVFLIVTALALSRERILDAQGSAALPYIRTVWRDFLPFIVLYLVHDLLVSPFLFKNKRVYFVLLTALLASFIAYFLIFRSAPPAGGPGRPRFPGDLAPQGPPHRIFDVPEMMRILMAFLVVGTNLGVKFFFRSVRQERRLQELQTENLNSQLATLRYQVNPHFFMNTLNNIHALVDIDPERAKESIESFSILMRQVLYGEFSPTIPLSRELGYVLQFVALMRLRYTDDVDIVMDFPSGETDAQIPPLLLISFVENAFKHGISYESDSFIRAKVSVEEGRILFRCVNSRFPSSTDEPHGVGMDNVRRRLSLLYGTDYSLEVDENENEYGIRLSLPERQTQK